MSTYTIRINDQRGVNNPRKQTPNYCQLSLFNGNTDFYNVILECLQELKTRNTNDQYNTYMKVAELYANDRSISGVIESGSYGVSSNLLDVETDSITHKRKENEADVLPFYFLFYLPKETNEGVLILQRTGKSGIRTIFGNFLKKHFSKKYRGFLLEINTLVSKQLIQQILDKGTIKKLRCVKYDAPTDLVDGLDEGHQEIPMNMEIVLSGNKIPFMKKIKNFFNDSNHSIKGLIEIRDYNFDYDTVKVEVEIDGNMRTFDLYCLYKIKNYYDISDQITMNADVQTTFESIQEVAKNYLTKIIEELYP
ncbi:hypothetical protein [Rippkaea orientalis]|uniref:hypothetical protein n=1 Tax=Rippkaea orientalis TaxID=2546366 RepID=UPI00193D74E3|nr:hypothetical protein [Rippkaea orientalis]